MKKNVVRLYQDSIFCCVLGREGMEQYLIGLLNAIFTQLDFPLVKKLTIKNPYQFPTNENQKTSILDVFAEDEKGRKIDVEMQTRDQEFFNKRVIYYAARNYVDQSRKGEDYGKLYPSYVVVLTRFPLPDRPKDCWIDYQNFSSGLYSDLRYDDITIIYVRIPDKPGMEIPEAVLRQLQDWMRYIGSDVTPQSEIKEILSRDATIKELDDVVARFTASEEGQMILTREDIYRIDRIEQNKLIEKQALERGMRAGKAEMIECNLRVRFPYDFADCFQPWHTKLYEKTLDDLDSLAPLSVSCASLNEFTQKL